MIFKRTISLFSMHAHKHNFISTPISHILNGLQIINLHSRTGIQYFRSLLQHLGCLDIGLSRNDVCL